jgi:two-component system, NarL family, invasion response regulator UvrY
LIKVIVCDDHAMVRRGIKETLSEALDIQVVAESSSYAEVKDALRQHACDVLILDLNLPGRGGMDVLASLKDAECAAKVLVVSMFAEDQYAIRCLRAGAHGYLNKAGDPAELITAVRALSQGRKYVTAAVSEMLIDQMSEPEGHQLHDSLSERELQTLLKIASGKRLSDIAQEMLLSPKTVSVYRSRLLEKLKLTNNAELTVYAIRNALV